MTSAQIKELRTRLKMSQEAFAQALRVSFATVNRWENGRAKPQAEQVHRMQALLAAPEDAHRTQEWREELARAETERAKAETKLDNALRHLAEVQASQIEWDRRFRKALLHSLKSLLEGLRESPSEGGESKL